MTGRAVRGSKPGSRKGTGGKGKASGKETRKPSKPYKPRKAKG